MYISWWLAADCSLVCLSVCLSWLMFCLSDCYCCGFVYLCLGFWVLFTLRLGWFGRYVWVLFIVCFSIRYVWWIVFVVWFVWLSLLLCLFDFAFFWVLCVFSAFVFVLKDVTCGGFWFSMGWVCLIVVVNSVALFFVVMSPWFCNWIWFF